MDRTRVTLVGVGLKRVASLGVLKVALGDDLVHGESTTTKDLASVAVAVDESQFTVRLSSAGSRSTNQRMCLLVSWSSLTVQVVWPQWHWPW